MSPQLENGHIRIANELFEAFYRCKLTEYERVIMMHIWRKTYGFNKHTDWIANSQFSEETGIPRPHVTRTVKTLITKKIVTRAGNKLSIDKNYKSWLVEWRVTSPGNRVTSSGNKKLPHQVPTKDSKDNIQKTYSEQSSVNKPMPWNKESDETYQDHVVDYDGDGSTTNPAEEKRAAEKAQNVKFRAAVDWLIEYQDRDPIRTSVPKQLKAIKKLYTMGVSAKEAKQVIKECEASPMWQGRLEKPDYWTVVSVIQKRG